MYKRAVTFDKCLLLYKSVAIQSTISSHRRNMPQSCGRGVASQVVVEVESQESPGRLGCPWQRLAASPQSTGYWWSLSHPGRVQPVYNENAFRLHTAISFRRRRTSRDPAIPRFCGQRKPNRRNGCSRKQAVKSPSTLTAILVNLTIVRCSIDRTD